MSEVKDYLFRYMYHVEKLTEEEIHELEQRLEAIRFISRDFQNMSFVDDNDAYSIMHDKENEMVERVRYSFSLKY